MNEMGEKKKKKKNLILIASCDRITNMAQTLTRIFTVVAFYYYYFTFYNLIHKYESFRPKRD